MSAGERSFVGPRHAAGGLLGAAPFEPHGDARQREVHRDVDERADDEELEPVALTEELGVGLNPSEQLGLADDEAQRRVL
jgi:hypothetical protein